MTRRRSSNHVELVPVAERVWAMMAFRGVLVLVLIALWLGVPGMRHRSLTWHLVVSVLFLLVTFAISSLVRTRNRRLAVGSFGAGLLIDGLFLSLNSYVSGGLWNYVAYLVAAHLVAAALLGSFRTGIKITCWHSLLALGLLRAQQTDLLTPIDASVHGRDVEGLMAAYLAVLWFVALSTSTLAAVNERELRRRRHDSEALFRFSQSLHSTTTPAGVAERLTEFVADELDGDRIAVVEVRAGVATLLGGRRLRPPQGHPEVSALLEHVMGGRPRLVGNLLPAHDPWLASMMPSGTRVVMVPLTIPDELRGVLVFEHGGRSGARIERRVITAAEKSATDAALAISRSALLERVQAAAATDGLTGLANRRTFDESFRRALSLARRQGSTVSLAIVDIDHFKACNDVHGHQAGDEVLRAVGAALAHTSRGGDLPTRYGGEEFAVIMPGATSEAAHRAAERFRAAIGSANGPVAVTASLGVATFPDDGGDPGALIAAADRALYAAKENGRNQVVLAGAEPTPVRTDEAALPRSRADDGAAVV